jgi:Holliday junction resolvasome RuvABC ATP-dependent DNA helicase subunit
VHRSDWNISDVESLKDVVIETPKDMAKTYYNILLLGETGVGKSTFIELIASVLIGKRINLCDLDILDHTNDLTNQSQTNSTHLYEITCENGIVVSTGIREHGQ